MHHGSILWLRFAITLLVASTALAQGLPQPGLHVYQPTNSSTAYAVDLQGNVVNSWPGTANPGLAVYMAENGDLVRTRNIAVGPGGGGGGGAIERLDWDGNLLWSFQYTGPTVHTHHDIALMPNGNVLMIAWESIGSASAVAFGRNPNTLAGAFWSEKIIEVQPDGMGGAQIVWEWRAIDHVVQSFDPSAPNFDAPADRPERIDINYPAGNLGNSGDWLHCNGIDYHPGLDQIVISSRTFHEIWIIDHSTTTLEAAGSTGGLRGRGGDLLYRWGNPAAYGRGTTLDQKLFGQHDPQWIPAGRPGEGHLLVFNNGLGRPGGNYSSADEIVPPLNAAGTYDLSGGLAYLPLDLIRSDFHPSPFSFFSPTTSGCERQPNGNTLLVEGNSGFFIEIDPTGNLVWSWQNPFPTQGSKRTFKARRHAGGVVGNAYCDPAASHSGGQSARLRVIGSTEPSDNALTLWADRLPQAEFGFFLNGTGNGVTSMPGNAAGDLCVSTSIGRYNGLDQIFFSGSDGLGSLALDLSQTPTPMGPTPILSGQTWYFQCWYRDTPGMTSNFTNGIEVTF